MKLRYVSLVLFALLAIEQHSVVCEVESSLIIQNVQSVKETKPASSELRSASEVISAGDEEQANGELISEKSESLMTLPRVINLPRDNESSNQQSPGDKSEHKFDRKKGRKGKGRVKGKVLDGSPNPENVVAPDYEDDDEEYDDFDVAQALDKLTDPNSTYNEPITSPVEQINQPSISQPYAYQPPEAVVQPYQNDHKSPLVTFITDNSSPPVIAQPSNEQAVNESEAKPFKGEASFNFDEAADSIADGGQGSSGDGQASSIDPPATEQIGVQPGNSPPTSDQANEFSPVNEPSNEQPAAPFNGEAAIGNQQTNPPIDDQAIEESPAPTPNDEQVDTQPDSNQPNNELTREQSTANQQIDEAIETRPTESPLPVTNPQWLPDENYPPPPYLAPLQHAYSPVNNSSEPSVEKVEYSPITTTAPLDVYPPVHTPRPLENESGLDEPSQTKDEPDFIDEAVKLSNKLGLQPPTNDAIEPVVNEEANPEFLEGLYEEPHGTDDKEVNDLKLDVPSIYHTFKDKNKQAVSNPAVKLDTNTELPSKPSPSVSPSNSASVSASVSSPGLKLKNKIMNESPKIVVTKPSFSFPSMDLFRRSCAIKINGFSALGICRPTCGPKEVGIQVKLRETCTSYQLACDRPFELCCVPNLSEIGVCNVDLFRPNEILARIEKSLNLPQSSLVKLSHLQPAFIESVINYRAPAIFAPQATVFRDKSSVYYKQLNDGHDVSRPFIQYAKKNELRSLKEEESDDGHIYLGQDKTNTHFRTITNQVARSNPAQLRFAKVLRRVENPSPTNHVHRNQKN